VHRLFDHNVVDQVALYSTFASRLSATVRDCRCLRSQHGIVGHATARTRPNFTLVRSLIVPLSPPPQQQQHLAIVAENLHHG